MAASWSRRSKILYVFLRIYPSCVLGFLNLEELNEMKYGIQILPDPVILGQVRLSSQEATCTELTLTRTPPAYMFCRCDIYNASMAILIY